MRCVDTLVFRAQFGESVQNVDAANCTVNSTGTAPMIAATQVGATEYKITVSGGDLANYNGAVGLDLAMVQNITGPPGNALPTTEPTMDEIDTVHDAYSLYLFLALKNTL